MSTRSHIIVKGSKSEPEDQWGYIYHHFDGYPEGVGAELREQFKNVSWYPANESIAQNKPQNSILVASDGEIGPIRGPEFVTK